MNKTGCPFLGHGYLATGLRVKFGTSSGRLPLLALKIGDPRTICGQNAFAQKGPHDPSKRTQQGWRQVNARLSSPLCLLCPFAGSFIFRLDHQKKPADRNHLEGGYPNKSCVCVCDFASSIPLVIVLLWKDTRGNHPCVIFHDKNGVAPEGNNKWPIVDASPKKRSCTGRKTTSGQLLMPAQNGQMAGRPFTLCFHEYFPWVSISGLVSRVWTPPLTLDHLGQPLTVPS